MTKWKLSIYLSLFTGGQVLYYFSVMEQYFDGNCLTKLFSKLTRIIVILFYARSSIPWQFTRLLLRSPKFLKFSLKVDSWTIEQVLNVYPLFYQSQYEAYCFPFANCCTTYNVLYIQLPTCSKEIFCCNDFGLEKIVVELYFVFSIWNKTQSKNRHLVKSKIQIKK